MLLLPDGLVAGGSSSSGLSYGHPADESWNIFFCKLDPNRQVRWQRFYPTEVGKDDRIWAMTQTSDGGFLAGGYSTSGIGGVKTDTCRGGLDVWLVKLDADGNLLWDKTYGGSDREEIFAILETKDGTGDFLLGGHSKSGSSGEKSQDAIGDQDIWLLRIDSLGNLIWDKTIGGTKREQFHDMIFAPDGNILVSGATNSVPNSGDLGNDPARGGMDFLLMKINPADGQVIWNHRYGGDDEDVPYSLVVSKFDGIFIGGRTRSGQGPQKTATFYGGDSDFWLVKTDLDGNKLKDWGWGGSGLDDLKYIHEDLFGNLVLAGDTDSPNDGSKTTGSHGGYDFWLLSVGKTGEILWERTIGGTRDDDPTKIVGCPNGGFYVAGHSSSDIGFEKSEHSKGVNDFWIVNFCCTMTADIVALGDSTPCNNEPLTLEARVPNCDSCQLTWSTGDTGNYIELPPGTADTFKIYAVSKMGCIASDSVFAKIALPPTLEIGVQDTVMFEYEHITVGGNNPELQYMWNTGHTSSSIVVTYGGVYSLTVTDPNGCTARDFVNVKIVKKDHVWVPNVFTPNFDGANDLVNIYCDKAVKKVASFQIADRWGTVYHARNDFYPNYELDGWDGTHRGKRVPPGAYFWIAEVRYLDDKKEILGGTIFLKR